MFVFFASLWLVGAGALVSIVGRRICGDGCPVVTVASKVIPIACVIIALACPLFFVLVVIRIRMADSSVAMAEEDDQAAEKSWATVARELLHDTLALGLLASMIFLLIMVGGELLKRSESIKGARRERFGSVISFVGSVGAEAVYCLVIVPITAVRMWKTWRMP
ncbi:hypothetical protein QOZ80_8AG0630690 [Eleusine coracana subsp. coracana]|nr:hypothetical protein QOZ80_8AG0630690 [Eleusine coracana subsp. coracana]